MYHAPVYRHGKFPITVLSEYIFENGKTSKGGGKSPGKGIFFWGGGFYGGTENVFNLVTPRWGEGIFCRPKRNYFFMQSFRLRRAFR